MRSQVIGNRRGSAMVAVVALAVILNVMLLAFYFSTRHTSRSSGNRRLNVIALNIAEAGKERLYSEVRYYRHRPIRDTTLTIYSDVPFQTGFYTVSYSSDINADTLRITSRGLQDSTVCTIDVIALIDPEIPIPAPDMRGAVTARSTVEVTGNITIEGMDHDTSCNVNGSGVYGISSSGSVLLGSNSVAIGGKGYPPFEHKQLEKSMALVTESGAAIDTSLFRSPEAFLGLEEGALDSFKTGACMPPAKFRDLVYDTCSYVGPVNFDTLEGSAGILIVHNAAGTASLKVNRGIFRGLIITDRMDKINGDVTIHGAIAVLSDSAMVLEGLGNSKICYSSEILNNLTDYCDNIKKRVSEISWMERK